MTTNVAVGASVRAELARRKLTQGDVARWLGISQASVSDRLKGKTPFRIDELMTIAEEIGIPLAAMLTEKAGAA